MNRILIANRGEIATRVGRACREAGIEPVGLYGPGDEHSPHLLPLVEAHAVPSYLDLKAIIAVAGESGAEGIHPGYGFLAENAAFASAVREAGLIWIGPPAEAIRAMGSKAEARRRMQQAGVPLVPGTEPLDPDGEPIVEAAAGLGYPVFVKAVAGGGGKGMRLVHDESELKSAATICRDEAERAFGDGSIYLEKALLRPRHVEIQVFADDHGNTVSLFERECSIQRRHQKIIEECPSPVLDEALREAMGKAAIAAAEAVDYRNAGTVEFLVEDGAFYMLEMNTRLQVEHPVTEAVTGLDLVRLQFEVAEGRPLPPEALAPTIRGHALECRVYAEDPASDYLPSAGTLLRVREPKGPGVRVDAALCEGMEFGTQYDPMIAKVITWCSTRAGAIQKMDAALRDFVILGVRTNLEHLRSVLSHEAFGRGDLTNRFLEEHMPEWKPDRGEAPRELLLSVAAVSNTGTSLSRANGMGAAQPTPWQTLGDWRVSTGEGS